jgi:serine/threonine protein kinase
MPGTVRPPSSAGISVPQISVSSPAAHAITSFAPSSTSNPSLVSSPGAMAKVCPTCGVHYPAEFKVCPRDATELNEAQSDDERDELVGQTLSQSYTIVRPIGEGGMGKVYEARHTRIGSKRFAIKMLHPEYARQSEVISRFQREAEAAATIRSPHVVDVYDVDRTTDGRPFLVAEFLEGREFAEYLDEIKKMQVAPAVRIVRQICKALAAAHAKGVVHRDMKPENVYLTGEITSPIAKVIDFGISKVGDAPGTALTKTGMIMGTPAYMAPEQARGERVDHRADIYAVGAILYCALTGERPFDRGDPTATLTAVLTQDPQRPRAIEPSIPEPLEMIIQRAMSKRPEDRYSSMAELDADLAPWDTSDGLVASSPTDPSEETLARRTSGSLQRQTREVSMARPMILLLGGLGLFWATGIVLTMIAGIVRLVRGGGATANVLPSEALFLVLGIALALTTPLILVGRYVSRTVWNNSVKAVDLAASLRGPVLVGLSAYGFGQLLVRFLESVILRHAVGVAWPVWDLLLFVVGVAAALGAFALHRESKKA